VPSMPVKPPGLSDIYVDIILDIEASFNPKTEKSYNTLDEVLSDIKGKKGVQSQYKKAEIIDIAYSKFHANKPLKPVTRAQVTGRALKADPSKFVGDFWKREGGPSKLLQELRDFSSGKTTSIKFVEPIDALTEFLDDVLSEVAAAKKLNQKVRLSGWSLQYDLPVIMGNIENILATAKTKDQTIINKIHKLRSVYGQLVDNIDTGHIVTRGLETPFLKYRAALIARAYDKYGTGFTKRAKINEDLAKRLSQILKSKDTQALDELISNRSLNFGGYRVEDVLKFLGLFGEKEEHRAIEDVIQEAELSINRFDLFDFFKDDPYKFAKKHGGEKLTKIAKEDEFYTYAYGKIIDPRRMGDKIAAQTLDSPLIKGVQSKASRLAFNKVVTNKAFKIGAIGAAAVVGLGVVQRLWDSMGDDDYANKNEALIGSSHKKFGIFGSGFRGGKSDYLDQKIEEARSRGSMYVGSSYVGLPTKDIRKKLVKRIRANAGFGTQAAGGRKTTSDTTYSAVAAEFGTFAHQIAQREEMDTGSYSGKDFTWKQRLADSLVGLNRGAGVQAEYKIADPKTGMYGSIDVVRGDVIIEHKFVTAGIFETIVRTGKPFPSHVMQINAYMGMMGHRRAQLIYTNRENLKQRVVFDVDFGEKAYKATARKVRKASRQAMRDALEMGIDVSSMPVEDDLAGGPNEPIPSMAELKERYPVELFHALTVRRGIPTNLEKVRKERDLDQQRVRTRKGNIIEGMRHGWFGSSRKDRTDFGSGFRPESEYGTPDNVWASRAVAAAAVGGFAYGMAKHPVWMYKQIRNIEDRSPLQILKTFRLSERMQPRLISHLDQTGKKVISAKELLIRPASAKLGSSFEYAETDLTPYGKMIQRMLGGIHLDANGVINFTKDTGNFYKTSVGGVTKYVTFAEANTRLASSTYRYHKPVRSTPISAFEAAAKRQMKALPGWVKDLAGVGKQQRTATENILYNALVKLKQLKLSQIEQKLGGTANDALVPIYVTAGKSAIGREADVLLQKSRRAILGGFERFNRLAGEVGLGLPAGSFNRAITLPWNDLIARTPVGKKLGMAAGRRGFINQFLAKRYLPISAAVGALGFLDYATGHMVSDMPMETYANMQIGAATVGRLTGMQQMKSWMNTAFPVPDYGVALAIGSTAAIGSYVYADRIASSGKIEEALTRLGVTEKYPTYEKFIKQGTSELASEVYTPAYKKLKNKLLAKGLKGAALLAAPFIASALIPEESPQELRDIYSGRQEVEVMRGRWWETSSTPYEGDKTKEFRQHFVARYLNRQWLKDEYGSEGEYWKRNLATPIGWFNLLVDPYGKEREAAKRGRRFPLSEELFLDVPFSDITGLRLIGHAIKPPRFMHARSAEGLAKMYESENQDLEPSYELGGLKPFTPQMPWSISNLLARQVHQYSTIAGLPGFLATATSKKLLGDENVFIDKYRPTLQSANEIGSQERWFYGLELGGAAFLSEPIRRVIQKTPRQFGSTYNPIPNNVPSWLSGENELKKLYIGDPYSKVGFNARYLPPAGEGEEYNDLQKAEALAHLQPYSRRLTRLFTSLDEQQLDPFAQYKLEELKSQVKSIKEREKFTENMFAAPLAGYSGTVEQVEGEYLTLKEYPFKEFRVGGFHLNSYEVAKNFVRSDNLSAQEAAIRAARAKESARAQIEKAIKPGGQLNFAAAAGGPENQRQVDIAIFGSGGLLNKQIQEKYNLPIQQDTAISQLMYAPHTRAVGTAMEALFHDPALPTMAKFSGKYTALEKYKKERVYGKKIKLWDNPVESFILQPAYGGARRFGSVAPFNPFSGFDDDEYNTIGGLKGSVHQQFGVFGSGFLKNMASNLRRNVSNTASKLLGRGSTNLLSSKEKMLLVDVDSTMLSSRLDRMFEWAKNAFGEKVAEDLYGSYTARLIASRLGPTQYGSNILDAVKLAKEQGLMVGVFTNRLESYRNITMQSLRRAYGKEKIGMFDFAYFGAGKKHLADVPNAIVIDDRPFKSQGIHPGNVGMATALIRNVTQRAGGAGVGSGFTSSDKYVPVPGYTENVRKYNEYFDKLEYIKWVRLAKEAESKGDTKLLSYYMSKARGTMIGINPLIADPEMIAQVIPKGERPYFMAFANEPNPEKRQEILEMLPASERRLMAATWFRQMNHASMSESEIPQYREYVRNEGYMTDMEQQIIPGLSNKYAGEVEPAILDRMAEIYQFLEENNLPLPGENWKGWQSQVDMQDIKLMYLKSIGEDIHEYDLWEDRERMLARKPYLKGTIDPIRRDFTVSGTLNHMDKILENNGVFANRYSATPTTENSFTINLGVDPDTMLYDTDFNRAMDGSLKQTREGHNNLDLYLGRM